MNRLDWVAAALLFALGCVHNFIAAPMGFDKLDARALWFVTGGMSLWFAAALNLLWLADRGRRLVRLTVLAANLLMLAFTLSYATVTHQFGNAGGWLLIAIVGWLTARSALVAPAPRSSTM